MGSATGTSKGHAKSRRWVLYGVEANRDAKKRKAHRTMRRSPCTTAGENQKRIQASALLFFREIFKCRIKPGAASAALPPPGRFGGPSLKRRCGRTRGRRVKRERDATRAFLKLVSSPARFNDGAAPLVAQLADKSRVVPPKGSKSRSNQPQAGHQSNRPPKKPDCSGQAGVSAWRHHPARCRGLQYTDNGSK